MQCGVGIKSRDVWCEDIHGKQVHSSRCRYLRRRPRSERACRRNTCGIWETGLWGEVSVQNVERFFNILSTEWWSLSTPVQPTFQFVCSVLQNVVQVKALEVCDAEEIPLLWMINIVQNKRNPMMNSLAILRNVNLKMETIDGSVHHLVLWVILLRYLEVYTLK